MSKDFRGGKNISGQSKNHFTNPRTDERRGPNKEPTEQGSRGNNGR